MQYICDNGRHLICLPYSISNLHKTASELGIKRCWYHAKKGYEHYDIPKSRIEEIKSKCKIVSSKEILKIIKENHE